MFCRHPTQQVDRFLPDRNQRAVFVPDERVVRKRPRVEERFDNLNHQIPLFVLHGADGPLVQRGLPRLNRGATIDGVEHDGAIFVQLRFRDLRISFRSKDDPGRGNQSSPLEEVLEDLLNGIRRNRLCRNRLCRLLRHDFGWLGLVNFGYPGIIRFGSLDRFLFSLCRWLLGGFFCGFFCGLRRGFLNRFRLSFWLWLSFLLRDLLLFLSRRVFVQHTAKPKRSDEKSRDAAAHRDGNSAMRNATRRRIEAEHGEFSQALNEQILAGKPRALGGRP